jgi:acyl-CoA thioester hydrolase
MTRIKIDFPDRPVFTTLLSVRITDINYGGHLGNDAVLSLVHEARLRFLNNLGYSEMDIEGKSLIMSDAAIVYKSEGHYSDQLQIEIAVTDFSGIGFDILYRIVNTKTHKTVALVKTGMVFFDYQTKRPVTAPPVFKEKTTVK